MLQKWRCCKWWKVAHRVCNGFCVVQVREISEPCTVFGVHFHQAALYEQIWYVRQDGRHSLKPQVMLRTQYIALVNHLTLEDLLNCCEVHISDNLLYDQTTFKQQFTAGFTSRGSSWHHLYSKRTQSKSICHGNLMFLLRNPRCKLPTGRTLCRFRW